MGYDEFDITMASRRGSISSGVGCSPGVTGQTKSSPFCPSSSSKLTQSIIKDHMVSHYKKVYSAKAAIDTSVPKSLIHSVKYNDQIRREQLKKGDRPQSAHSLSQRNSRASCSSVQSRLSLQYDESAYLCSRSSTVSSPRFSTSFHAKEIVYPLYKAGSQHHPQLIRPESERKYRSPEAHRKQSACSLGALEDQSCYKTFQDPVQKTYSGDLLQKHSQHFTKGQPFTPKTLKSAKRSYLSQYRYYRAPQKEPTQGRINSRLMRQETYHGSTKTNECTEEFYAPSQGFNTEHEFSEDGFTSTYFSVPRGESRTNKTREHDFLGSSSRVSPEGWKSPMMKSVSAEEEELMYLEFISAVTEDILSRGHISDRFLDRVMKHHIDMNRHQLDVGKMRHLLEVLRKDFQEPTNMSASSTELEKQESDLLDSLLPHLKSRGEPVKTKEENDLFPNASLLKYCDLQDYAEPLLVSTPLPSPPTKINEQHRDGEDVTQERGVNSPWLSEHVFDNTAICEEEHRNQEDTAETNKEAISESATITSDKACHQDQAEDSYDGQSKELDNLGRRLSESLHVSSSSDYKNVDSATEQHANTAASVSDDEF